MKLFDSLGATSEYKIEFDVDCYKFKDTSRFNLTSLKPVVRNIDSEGLIKLSWNVDLLAREFENNGRRLSNNFSARDCLVVQIMPGAITQFPRDLNFTFNISKFEPKLTEIQLNFNTPSDISRSPVRDSIRIGFNQPKCFTSI